MAAAGKVFGHCFYSRMADNKARDLKRQKELTEKRPLNLMPRSVFEEMRDFGSVTPMRFDEATILMLDFVGLTEMKISRNRDPSSASSTTSSAPSTGSSGCSTASG
jgi:hypothetical protein